MATVATRRPSGPVLAHYRSASPARVNLAAGGCARSAGPSVSVSSSSSSSSSSAASGGVRSRRSCMCSPTNHPGSFRCSLHKERNKAPGGHAHHPKATSPTSPPSPGSSSRSSAPTSSRLGAAASRRMGSALVRIGAVEGGGEWARRALAATVRPSPAAQQAQHRRRVGGYRPGPSRLSAVSMAGNRAGDNEQ